MNASRGLRWAYVMAGLQLAEWLALVHLHWYRTGGILQILSSSLHVPKGDGLVGMVGGVKAYRYPRYVTEPVPDSVMNKEIEQEV